jgi:hypothetical protein
MILMTDILNVVRASVSPVLAQYGFIYSNINGKQDVRYERKIESGREYITFSISQYDGNTLRIEFSTSEDSFGIDSSNFVRNPDVARTGYWSFNKDTMHIVIQELLEITINYGLPWFEQKRKPDLDPPEELERRLLEYHQEYAKVFQLQYRLPDGDVLHLLSEIEKILLEQKHQDKEPHWELLLQASAFVGELIRQHLGGEWVWDKPWVAAGIKGIGGKKMLTFHCLLDVSRFWNKPDFSYFHLTEQYQFYKFYSELKSPHEP